MCILFIANNQRDDFPLIIAANRDEFYARPTAPSHFWKSHPELLAGQDLQADGTWMGVTKQGRIAALTNIRDPRNNRDDAISRGELVANWLKDNNSEDPAVDAKRYEQAIQQSRQQYNGYNLVFGHVNALQVYNNANNTTHAIGKGVYGLSNADIVTHWPKVTQGINALNDYISNADKICHETLFNILKCEQKAPDERLPNTGISYEWEKALSSIFIHTPEYGTRTSTILLLDRHNRITWKERCFSNSGNATETREFSFSV